MSAALRPPIRMTVQEFLAWAPGDSQRYELVDGEPRAMAPPSTVHGLLQNELGALIRNYLRASKPHCRVIANPGVVPRLLSTHNVRVPDLAVTCSPVLPGQATLPDPVLLVEILSPSNQADTWSNVWAYTSIPSVQEILVLNSTRIAGELLRRSATREWAERLAELGGKDELILESIGFRVTMADLYADTGLSS